MPKILLSPDEILDIADKLEGISLSDLLRSYAASAYTGGPDSILPDDRTDVIK